MIHVNSNENAHMNHLIAPCDSNVSGMAIDPEATQFDNIFSARRDDLSVKDQNVGSTETSLSPKFERAKRVASSAGAGIFIGGLSAMLMGMGKDQDSESSDNSETASLSHPEWVVDDISIASSVTDDMSYSQAFQAARTEVGAGGVFEWHGQLYGTYYESEWNAMTASQRAEYGSHFRWNHIDKSGSALADNSVNSSINASEDNSVNSVIKASDHELASNDVSSNTDNMDKAAQIINEDGCANNLEDVQILGVAYDQNLEAMVDNLFVVGDEIIFIDVDDDGEFEYSAMDHDHNGRIDLYEVEIMDPDLIPGNQPASVESSNELYYLDGIDADDGFNNAEVIC